MYLRNLSRALVDAGHEVTVFSGPPYADLDPRVRGVEVPSLGLNPLPEGAGTPMDRRFPRSWADAVELGRALGGGFGEPQGFSVRVRRLLRAQRGRFDLVHDNQTLGPALGGLLDDGWPLVATIHHPLTVDRDAALARAGSAVQAKAVRRWWGFVDEQAELARRLPKVLTVSATSAADIAQAMGVARECLEVAPVGTDPAVFRPGRPGSVTPGRLVAVSNPDALLKGLVHLIDALPVVRAAHPHAHLHVVARSGPVGAVAAAIERHGLADAVTFRSGLSEAELVAELAAAQVAVVPSIYEGFSLPSVEAMACGRPVVATTGGALPEVVGTDGRAGVLVPPADPAALGAAIAELLSDTDRIERMGAAGRERVLGRFTWAACAERTVEVYRDVLGRAALRSGSPAVAGLR